MNSRTQRYFWKAFERLPTHIQQLAREKFRFWTQDPYHPSLDFKLLRGDVWSVRINLQYRAMCRRSGDTVVWFWIGPHAEYDRRIAEL